MPKLKANDQLSSVTQLVAVHGKKATTTSLLVAEIFGKQHKNVLQAIDSLIADLPESDRLNFQPVGYLDAKGERRPMYEMTRDGFSLLAMGFTGKKALEWKLKFLKAFNFMEQSLLNQKNLSWQEARSNNKVGRHDETDVIARFIEYAAKQGSQNAQTYYMNLTKMTYRALFLVGEASPQPFRDMLDTLQITFLTTAEFIVQAALEEGMSKLMHYKDIYLLARNKVTGFAVQLPVYRLEVRPAQALLFH